MPLCSFGTLRPLPAQGGALSGLMGPFRARWLTLLRPPFEFDAAPRRRMMGPVPSAPSVRVPVVSRVPGHSSRASGSDNDRNVHLQRPG